MKHLDLFSGIGGFALAAKWAGIETVAFCEIEEFPRKVLQKNFPCIPIHNDIHELDGKDYAGIDIITGGFPCQPFSAAGNQKGDKDDRYLWPQMLRIIGESRPAWVIAENVNGLLRMGIDKVLADLEAEGYTTRTLIIPACGKNAQHRRDRLWILANSTRNGNIRESRKMGSEAKEAQKLRLQSCDSNAGREWVESWDAKPEYDRAINGVSTRMDRDRIKSIGNAIVPQVAYEILRTIKVI